MRDQNIEITYVCKRIPLAMWLGKRVCVDLWEKFGLVSSLFVAKLSHPCISFKNSHINTLGRRQQCADSPRLNCFNVLMGDQREKIKRFIANQNPKWSNMVIWILWENPGYSFV